MVVFSKCRETIVRSINKRKPLLHLDLPKFYSKYIALLEKNKLVN